MKPALVLALVPSLAAAAPQLTRIVDLPVATQGRLRLDADGHPYLIGRSTIVPVQKLASGEPAKPFRIAGVTALDDVAWTSDGVMMIVAGQELGVIGATGFAQVVALPAPHMRVVAGGTDAVWLASVDGRLFSYRKGGALAEVIHVPAAIADVSATPDRVYLAAGSSIVRASGSAAELVFDAADPITAVAATGDGVVFSTTRGVFALLHDRVTRLTDTSALAIAVHGDDVFVQLAGVGVVRGSLAALVAEPTPVTAAALPEPELTSPPARAEFVAPSGPNDFRDIRLAIGMGIGGSFSTGAQTGSLAGAYAVHVDRVWSSNLPGLVWSIGIDLDRAVGDIAHPGATLDNMALHLGLGYGFVFGDNVQVELGPVVEGDGAALDEPFSSGTAWGNGWGIGGRLAIHYTAISGLELGGVVGYAMRWYSLAGDCTPCAMPGFNADVSMTSASLSVSVGKRY